MSEVIKVCAIADLHGHLPQIEPCQFLLLGGDICPHFANPGSRDDVFGQARWLGTVFDDWLNHVPAKHIVATVGNHDFVFEKHLNLVPTLKWHLLIDRAVTIEGVKFYGSPHQKRFMDWAFNLDEPQLKEKWRWISDDTDILVLHGPPQGYGDFVPTNAKSPNVGEHVGSVSLLERILKIRPKLTIFGHIHNSHGVYEVDGIKMANVSILDDNYRMVYKPTLFEM